MEVDGTPLFQRAPLCLPEGVTNTDLSPIMPQCSPDPDDLPGIPDIDADDGSPLFISKYLFCPAAIPFGKGYKSSISYHVTVFTQSGRPAGNSFPCLSVSMNSVLLQFPLLSATTV